VYGNAYPNIDEFPAVLGFNCLGSGVHRYMFELVLIPLDSKTLLKLSFTPLFYENPFFNG
jgi:hypothetical protein